MGVPKFYRWISERFPCLSETVKDHQIPEFDNLYLDMNGIVHVCSHPDDGNPHFRITEEKIFADIFHYLEVLFRMIKPRKVFFMAIDGVAPRAKMNQQRGRRFRSAKDAELLEKKAKSRGETLPTEARFDSNCITPGTEFMVRLHKQLQYFVVSKQSRDDLWKGVTVYLSGHETPGEGEHKIMDFIRSEKAKPDYNPNTRHCLYGLDADLIMLGLTTHEPHFALLREEVRFGKQAQKRSNTVEETTFHLLHISILREYLDMEFGCLKDELATTRSFQYDLERVIDDWVLMGFLVGNDFIPHLPHLHIAQDALPTIWATYKQILPSLGGYLNDKGDINMYRLERLLTALSQWELDRFSDGMADMKWMDSKTSGGKSAMARKAAKDRKKETNEAVDEMDLFEDGEFAFDEDMPVPYIPERAEGEEGISYEFRKHKSAYYFEKMDLQATPEVLAQQARDYVTGLQWISHYYYTGVPSWGWFFPHHYAPYMSDLHSFADLQVAFDQGTPFMPFQQLMAVLPAASKALLPEAYRPLMLSSHSPIIDFYPQDFETDLNGKRQDWEAVVLIPFINESQLIEAMQSVEHKLTPAEIARNIQGPCHIYRYSQESQGAYNSTLPNFPSIAHNHTTVTEKTWDEFVVSIEQLRAGLCSNVRPTLYYPGFPTFAHLKYMSYLQKMGVTIFQQASRGENRMVKILDDMDVDHIDLVELGKQYLGKSIWVNWPHLMEAKVFSVETDTEKVVLGGKDNSEVVKSTSDTTSHNIFLSLTSAMAETMEKKRGVDITDTFVLVHAQPLTGRKYVYLNDGRVTVDKEWQPQTVPYALQACVSNERMLQFGVEEAGSTQFFTLKDVFPEGSSVHILANPHYGCEGQVIDHPKGRVKVKVNQLSEPNLQPVHERKAQTRYMRAFEVAQHLGVSSHFISRITGTLYLANRGDNINVGLNLKNSKKNEECPGFTRKEEADWLYSQDTENIIYSYLDKFPDFCGYLHENLNKDKLMTDNVFPQNRDERCRQVTDFLKSLPTHNCPRARCGNEFVEASVVAAIEQQVEKWKRRTSEGKHNIITVKPAHIYKQYSLTSTMIPDPGAVYQLLDRVVNVRQGYTVPHGLRGTVIGVIKEQDPRDEMVEVVFDSEFACGLTTRCTPGKGYRCPPHALINMSHGARLANQKGYTANASKASVDVNADGQGKRYSATMNIKGQGHKNKSSNASNEPSQQTPVTVLRRQDPSKAKKAGYSAGEPTVRTVPSTTARRGSPHHKPSSPAHGKGGHPGSAKNRSPGQPSAQQQVNGSMQPSHLMTPNDFVTPKTAKTDGRKKSQEKADHTDVWAKLKTTKNGSKQANAGKLNAAQLGNSSPSLTQAMAALKNIHPPPSQPPRVGKPLTSEEMQELPTTKWASQVTPKAGEKIDVQTLLSGGRSEAERPRSKAKKTGEKRQVEKELYDASKQKTRGIQNESQKQAVKGKEQTSDVSNTKSSQHAQTASDQDSGGFNFESLVLALENINVKPGATSTAESVDEQVKVEPQQPMTVEQAQFPHTNPVNATSGQTQPRVPLIAQAPTQQYAVPMQHPQSQGHRPSSSEVARAAGLPLMAANGRPIAPVPPNAALQQWTTYMRLPPPAYYFNPVPQPLFQVTVVVGQIRYVGSLTRDKMVAIHSAASVALAQINRLVQQQQRMHQVAANSQDVQPVLINHPVHHQVHAAAVYGASTNCNHSSFVPMQVTRKSANEQHGKGETLSATPATEVKMEPKTPNSSPNSTVMGKPEPSHARNASSKKPSANKSNKKTKSRLAANFGESPRT